MTTNSPPTPKNYRLFNAIEFVDLTRFDALMHIGDAAVRRYGTDLSYRDDSCLVEVALDATRPH